MDGRIQFLRVGKPITEEQLVSFERDLGIKLPSDYRTFLMRTNGGKPNLEAFPIKNDQRDTHGLIHRFLSLGHEHPRYDLLYHIQAYHGRIPADIMPIASDPGGSVICLAVNGKFRGEIYFWDHDDETPFGRTVDYHNVYFVAQNFDELLNNLSEFPDTSCENA